MKAAHKKQLAAAVEAVNWDLMGKKFWRGIAGEKNLYIGGYNLAP